MIRVESRDEGRVAVLWLSRPEKRNALTPSGLSQLAEAATEGARDARVLVLAGEGKVFCAGFDLSLCRASPEGAVMRELLTNLSRAIATMRGLSVPVVAAAHGAAIAGGCALLGGADIVVGDVSARYGYPVVRLGVSPAVSAPFLRAVLAGGSTRERLLNPSLISGSQAHQQGLVHELVQQADDVLLMAMSIARSLARKPNQSLATTKRWLNELDGTDNADTIERALNVSLARTGSDEECAYLPAAWTKDPS
jgi:methylglutaconyl-CoA hydratase